MNEKTIEEMKKFFVNIPKPKEKVFKDLWAGLENRIIKDLQSRPIQEVLDWLKSQIILNPDMQGPKMLSNSCKQTYAKLWKLKKKYKNESN